MRVVLHAHSTWSYDGHWPLARIARVFGALGVDAVMMTEHDTGFDPGSFGAYRDACAQASTRRCRIVPGIEYSSPDNAIHILTWGLRQFLAEHRPVSETLRRVREAGGVAVLAHPVRRDAWRQFDPGWIPLLDGIELWNRKSDGLCPGKEAQRLIAETGLPATLGVDFHGPKQIYPLAHLVDCPADSDPETALVAALRAGGHRLEAFWRPLTELGGGSIHPRLEGLRKGLVSLRQRLRG